MSCERHNERKKEYVYHIFFNYNGGDAHGEMCSAASASGKTDPIAKRDQRWMWTGMESGTGGTHNTASDDAD